MNSDLPDHFFLNQDQNTSLKLDRIHKTDEWQFESEANH